MTEINKDKTIEELSELLESKQSCVGTIGSSGLIGRRISKEAETLKNAIDLLEASTAKQNREKHKPVIYVCNPYRGTMNEMLQNMANANNYCKLISLAGGIPIAPHIYFTMFLADNDPKQRELGLQIGQELLGRFCDELWIFGSRISQGMSQEIAYAAEHNIPFKYVADIGSIGGMLNGR